MIPLAVTEKRLKQAVDGLLLLNKPSGMTSNRALQIVKRLLNARKAGHTGSLDPAATGIHGTAYYPWLADRSSWL